MPGCRVHDGFSLLAAVPASVLMTHFYGAHLAVFFVSAFLVSAFWLSPDLDLYSSAFRRWGYFRVLWVPYIAMVSHRTWVSHAPVWGSLIRLGWLVIITSPLWFTVLLLMGMSLDEVTAVCFRYPEESVMILAGLECAAVCHALLDLFVKN